MTTNFLPEWGQMSLGTQYVGLYRFFANQSWRFICDPATKQRRYFGTATDAIKAARDHVQVKLNPDIKSQHDDDEDVELKDALGLQAWRQQKQNERAESQIVRNRKSKTMVVVERKKEGRRRDRENT